MTQPLAGAHNLPNPIPFDMDPETFLQKYGVTVERIRAFAAEHISTELDRALFINMVMPTTYKVVTLNNLFYRARLLEIGGDDEIWEKIAHFAGAYHLYDLVNAMASNKGGYLGAKAIERAKYMQNNPAN